MRLTHANLTDDKGWYAGPWESDLAISIGFANKSIDEPHVHSQITEIYLVACGTAEIRVEQQTIQLTMGDMLIVEPGEAHTFLKSSPDYHHFVIHTPGLSGEVARTEKSMVSYVSPRKLGVGHWKGKIWIADDFDDLPDDILNLFTGEAKDDESFT